MKKLRVLLSKKSGRSNSGKVTVRHQGGREKRFLRTIDFRRDKREVWGKVVDICYDPNRNAKIALINYEDGDKRYILAPIGLEIGQKIVASLVAPIEIGNSLPLEKIPVGTQIHNIEFRPGKGGQIARGAGAAAMIQGKEGKYMLVKMPSAEVRRFPIECFATIGQVGNMEVINRNLRKAGTRRHMGIKPSVRGVAMNPNAHPHGGGEGRSGIGMKHPKTPYGRSAVGKTRNVRKYSNKFIIKGRKKGKHS